MKVNSDLKHAREALQAEEKKRNETKKNITEVFPYFISSCYFPLFFNLSYKRNKESGLTGLRGKGRKRDGFSISRSDFCVNVLL